MISTWKHLIQIGLDEDTVEMDWTARAIPVQSVQTATLIAKSEGIWAGTEGLEALRILSRERGMPLEITDFVQNGSTLTAGQKICSWRGATDSIVTFERTFINLAGYACGIASQTKKMVDRIQSWKLKNPPRITATRKTLPGYKSFAVESTIIGGAHPHRYNLSGGLLIKENHVAAAGGVTAAIMQAKKTAPHVLKIEIEVRNIAELKEALTAGAEIILLDNFSSDMLKEAIVLKKTSVLFEVSGGVRLENLDQYRVEGLDVLSIGSLTHSVISTDLSLLMDSIKK